MKKPKYFPKLKAWYYRNFKYKNLTFNIKFGTYKPDLFEILNTSKGVQMIYLGKEKYIEIKRKKNG